MITEEQRRQLLDLVGQRTQTEDDGLRNRLADLIEQVIKSGTADPYEQGVLTMLRFANLSRRIHPQVRSCVELALTFYWLAAT